MRNPNRRFTLLAALTATAFAAAAPLALANENKDELANDPGSEQPVTDTWITTKVKTALLAEDGVAGTDINVTTENGVVTLAGVLPTQAAVTRAVEVARGIEGVVEVDTRALTSR